MDKLLVTGITGFVGTNLSDYLAARYDLVGVSRTPSEIKNCKSYQDLKIEDFSGVKALVHLAGKSYDPKSETNNNNAYFQANTELTKKLYDDFLRSDCKTFVYISSVKAVADSVADELTEEVVCKPKTAFGKSKIEAERYILNNLQDHKRVYVLRPCMIHGPGMKGNLNLLYKMVYRGIPYPLGAFKNKRSFLSVHNLCYVITELVSSKIESGVYNVADDIPIATSKLVHLIGSSINKKVRVINLPKGIIRIAARFGDFLPLPLNTERLSKLTDDFVISNQKLKRALGGDLPLGSEEGILRTIETFKYD